MLAILGAVFLVVFSLIWGIQARHGLRFKFFFRGRAMLEELSRQHGEHPFGLPTFGFGGRMHAVSTKVHLYELAKAPNNHLLEHAWAAEQVKSQHALGVEWATLEQRHHDGNLMSSAIRTSWKYYAKLQPRFLEIIREELLHAFNKGATGPGGYREVLLCDIVESINTRLNTLWTLGEEHANNRVFLERGLKYSTEAKVISELAKLLPSPNILVLANLVKRVSGNEGYVIDVMLRILERERNKPNSEKARTSEKPPTLLEALVNRCPSHWTMKELLRDVNVTWNTTNFASPILITQVIQDLCRHAEYHVTLRQEVLKSNNTNPIEHLQLLDAFVTESMRTQCFSSTRIHRMALHEYTFSDGYTVPAGEIVQFNLRKMFLDEQSYPSANSFNAERHLNSRTRSTEISSRWPFWGTQHLPCPGRFYAVNLAKLLSICLLEDWDFKLKDGSSLKIFWRDFSVPHPKAKLLLKQRRVE